LAHCGAARRKVIAAVALAAQAALVFAALLGLGTPGGAELLAPTLDSVGVSLPASAQIPVSLALVDESGRGRTLAQAIGGSPAILILADYTCQTLCGPILPLPRPRSIAPGSSQARITAWSRHRAGIRASFADETVG
jgi:hypothetical protein